MFYLLFRYLKGEHEKDYRRFRSKEELIIFIEEKRNEIEINKIIEAKRELKFNWTLRLDEISTPILRGTGRKKKEKVEAEKTEPEQLDKEESVEEEIEEDETTSPEIEEERNGFKDEPLGELWQLEIRADSQGRKKRRCWNPNCKKWFVIKYKGQHYHQDTCRHQHQQKTEAL